MGSCFREKVGWRGATREHTRQRDLATDDNSASVLVVDDIAANRDLLRQTLEQQIRALSVGRLEPRSRAAEQPWRQEPKLGLASTPSQASRHSANSLFNRSNGNPITLL